MEIILLERVERLGMIGDVVNVKPGFARNFLLPKGKALRATKENRVYFEAQKAQIETNNLKLKSEAEKVAGKLEGTVLVMIRQAGESGQLYGSVNAKDIVEALAEKKVTTDRHHVKIDTPIKMIGLHKIRLALHPEVTVNITVNVAKSEEEAEAQLKGEVVATKKEAPAEFVVKTEDKESELKIQSEEE